MRKKPRREILDAANREYVQARSQLEDAERLLNELRIEIASVLRVERSATCNIQRRVG
jgi:hypothetical protein